MGKKYKYDEESSYEEHLNNLKFIDAVINGDVEFSSKNNFSSMGKTLSETGLNPEVDKLILAGGRNHSSNNRDYDDPDTEEYKAYCKSQEKKEIKPMVSAVKVDEKREIVEKKVEVEPKVEPVVPTVPVNEVEVDDDKVYRQIYFCVFENLKRCIISDGIAPTSLSISQCLNQDYNPKELTETIDDDNCGEILTTILKYIYSRKHPTCVFKYDEFVEVSKSFKVKRNRRFVFLNVENTWVLCYDVNTESLDMFFELFDRLELSNKEKVLTMLGLSSAADTYDQAFFIEDNDYIAELYSDVDLNLKDYFIELYNDEITEDDPYNNGLEVIDARGLQIEAINLISRITEDDDDDWEDDEDDDEDKWDEEIFNDYENKKAETDESVHEPTDNNQDKVEEESGSMNDTDVDNLLSDDMEVVNTETLNIKNMSDNPDEFVIPVIRRNNNKED